MTAGVVSFLPCIPALGSGLSRFRLRADNPARQGDRRRVLRRLLAGVGLFILGFAAVFTLYGAAIEAIGSWLLRWQERGSTDTGKSPSRNELATLHVHL